LPRVLIIDDTPETAELLSFALRDRGHEVFATGYTTSVNELLREQHADALVLNLSTWDMSEWLFDSVRDDAAQHKLPVVIISDTIETVESKLRERKAQRVLLVSKPFTGGQVAQALAQLLE
jgi:DNA-binding response OmpR family regulator